MKKIIVLCIVVLMFIAVNISARPNFNPSVGGASGNYHPTPPVMIVPPVQEFAELTASKVYLTLVSKKLAYKFEGQENIEYSDLAKKVIKFTYKHLTGCVYEFDSAKNLDTVQDSFLELNKNSLNNWSVTYKNIILVIDGQLPEEEFERFQDVLRRL